MAAEGRDGPAGQGAVSADQEAGHRPAGREGEERQRQRGALRNAHCNQSCAEVVDRSQTLNYCITMETTVQHDCQTSPFYLLHPVKFSIG